MNNKLITDVAAIDRMQWMALVERSRWATIFQTPAWFDFWKEQVFADTGVVAVTEEGCLVGVVVAIVNREGNGMKGHLTSRSVINGGPLLDERISEEALELLLVGAVKQWERKCIYIEIRNLNDYSRWRSVFESCGFEYMPHYNFHIDTTSVELVEKQMDRGRRRRVKKAVENHVVVSEDPSDASLFYQLLKDLYKKKVHKPLPPYEFFESLTTKPFAKYFIIKDPFGQIIGGQLILMLDHRVAYAMYCCGLDKEYHDLFPSIMANYSAIRWTAEQGFERYDMMGAGSPDKDYGVRDFKAQFGGALVEHGRFLFVCKPLIYKMGKFVINAISKS